MDDISRKTFVVVYKQMYSNPIISFWSQSFKTINFSRLMCSDVLFESSPSGSFAIRHRWSSSKDFMATHLPTPRNDQPIKKQKILHTTQWSTCPEAEGSKILSASVRSQCMGLRHGIACQRKLGYVMKLKHSNLKTHLFVKFVNESTLTILF